MLCSCFLDPYSKYSVLSTDGYASVDMPANSMHSAKDMSCSSGTVGGDSFSSNSALQSCLRPSRSRLPSSPNQFIDTPENSNYSGTSSCDIPLRKATARASNIDKIVRFSGAQIFHIPEWQSESTASDKNLKNNLHSADVRRVFGDDSDDEDIENRLMEVDSITSSSDILHEPLLEEDPDSYVDVTINGQLEDFENRRSETMTYLYDELDFVEHATEHTAISHDNADTQLDDATQPLGAQNTQQPALSTSSKSNRPRNSSSDHVDNIQQKVVNNERSLSSDSRPPKRSISNEAVFTLSRI